MPKQSQYFIPKENYKKVEEVREIENYQFKKSPLSPAARSKVINEGGSNLTAGPGGVEVKVAGFGGSIGKKIGFSTPIGGASIDLEEVCVVQ